jgi:large subunit ribosomal protein L21
MFAIIKTGGKQYRVQEGDVLSVEKIRAGGDQRIFFNQVLLITGDKETVIGTPLIEKAAVRARIVGDFKDEKVLVFKKKRRKQYRRTRGHRQELTRVRIERIVRDVDTYVDEEVLEPEKKVEKVTKGAETKEEAPAGAGKAPEKREVKPRERAEKAARPKAAKPKPKRAPKTKKGKPAEAPKKPAK